MPVRLTRSSTDWKRGGGSTGSFSWFVRFVEFVKFVEFVRFVQSCAQLLQKYAPAFTVSIIDSSSHPHFGHSVRAVDSAICHLPFAISMARPISSRSPEP